MPLRHPSLGLRTKFLLSLVVTIAGLSFATLLVVRHSAKKHLQQEIVEEAQNSQLTFQALLHQHQATLSRKANLLATLAAVTLTDDPRLQNSADNPLETEGSDLVALSDGDNRITTLHATDPHFTAGDAEQLLARSLRRGVSSDWWFTRGTLYQVVLQPVQRQVAPADRPSDTMIAGPRRQASQDLQSGTVIVGREVGYAAVHDMGRMSSSKLAFSYGGDIVASTLTPLDEHELGQRIQGLASQGQAAQGQIQIQGEPYFAISVALTDASAPGASLVILKSYREAAAFLSELNRLLIGLGLLALLTGTSLAIFISDTFTRPLANLDKGVQALERGNFNFPLETAGDDEVGRVTRAFDRMRCTLQKNESQKRQLEDQLRQSQKMEALGRLAGGVAHDFNNLLTVITGHSDLMVERLDAGHPLLGSGQQIRKAADRAAALTRQMLAFSRQQALEVSVFDLNALVTDMCKLLKRLIKEDIEFNFCAAESLGRVKADTGQIEQVLLNLVVNACDAMPQGGKLTIETHNLLVDADYARTRATLEEGHYTVLAVSDTGHGMDAETKARMFEPFFTTKEEGKGTGLGLATVYGVVKQSDGFIWVETAPGAGTRFELYLPRVEETIKPAQAEKIAPALARANETVLLAEDEGAVRDLACEFLTEAGYRVFVAHDGERALKIAEKLNEPIHLLVTDVVMPKMRGPELAERLKRVRPDMKVVYMSGYLDQNEGGVQCVGNSEYLQKPFSRDLLVYRVGAALRGDSVTAPAAESIVA
jgi:signal transduction histidine kinase/ActR/RegA family two-component response regulator